MIVRSNSFSLETRAHSCSSPKGSRRPAQAGFWLSGVRIGLPALPLSSLRDPVMTAASARIASPGPERPFAAVLDGTAAAPAQTKYRAAALSVDNEPHSLQLDLHNGCRDPADLSSSPGRGSPRPSPSSASASCALSACRRHQFQPRIPLPCKTGVDGDRPGTGYGNWRAHERVDLRGGVPPRKSFTRT